MSNVDNYLKKLDWRVNENANNGSPTPSGLMLYLANTEIAKDMLENVYPNHISELHRNADIHIHDLGFGRVPYCCGWSLGDLIKEGINKIKGKASSAPAKHLSSLLIQMVNFLGVMQMEAAGAEAFNNVDVYLSSFVKSDNLSYAQVKQYMQQLVFNLNIPSRWGCLSEDAEILTKNGWKYYNEVEEDEIIATFNVDKREVEYQQIQRMNVYDFNDKLYSIIAGDLEILTTPNHINVLYSKNKDKYFFSRTDNLYMLKPYCIPIYKNGELIHQEAKNGKFKQYKGKVWCPTVENETFIARRNGIPFITHNSQACFTNFTFDIKCPKHFKDRKAIIGGIEQNFTYGDCQKEMDMINMAFMEIMEEGDADGQIHTFPIPTYNIDKDFDWDSPVSNKLWHMTAKYGVPYFANYVNSDMDSSDVVSMCPLTKHTNIPFRELDSSSRQVSTIENIYNNYSETYVQVWTNQGWRKAKPIQVPITDVYEIKLNGGIIYKMGENHLQPVLGQGTIKASELLIGDNLPFCRKPFKSRNLYEYRKIIDINKIKCTDEYLYCFEVDSDDKLFMIDGGLITHNCRLRLDLSELRKRGGGFFGAGDLTGSIGVVTINLPRLGYISSDISEFYNRLEKILVECKNSLDIKRTEVNKMLDLGYLPYMKRYLKNGFNNHFSTIGIVGMNECSINMYGYGMETEIGIEFANDVMDFINKKLSEFQANSPEKILYNLEATPAEGTSYRFAKHDKEKYKDIKTANDTGTPYYTNSVHLPVGSTDDIFEVLEKQDELQSKFTSGTVIHLYLGEKIENPNIIKELTKKITTNYKLPYFSYTPTFSTCIEHGYIKGEVYNCPICNKETLVWSRVTGYLRPIQSFNVGKKQEFKDRKYYKIKENKPNGND